MADEMMAAAAAAAVSGGAYLLRALTRQGAVAAAGIGFVVFGRGGLGAALPLLFFFASASVLTKLSRRGRTGGDAAGRGALQVLANGLVPALAVLGPLVRPAPWWPAAAAGALAAVTADTWATEIGRFSPRPPVLITTWQRVRKGRSGAVSFLGTVGGAAGAVVLALVAAWSFGRWPLAGSAPGPLAGAFVLAVAAGGVFGLLVDSVLGATVQARYVCPSCLAETESPVHRCGRRTARFAGLPGVTNDTVNFLTSLGGAVAAAAAFAAAVP